jgi:ABC-type antimicrobial peptide transport system permease subunit
MPSKPIRTTETKHKNRIYLAIAALTLVILLVTLATAGKQQTLRCDRLATGEVDCVVKQSILSLITLNEKSIPNAQAISLGQQCPGLECTYRLEMNANDGLVPVNERYTSNYDQQIKIKNEVNNFFKDTTSSFVIMKEETNPYLITAVVLVVMLIWVYLGYLIWQANHPGTEDLEK